MKEELTEKMHSEFTVSKEIEIKHRVGSAIHYAVILKINKKEELEAILKRYSVGLKDYLKWREHYEGLGLRLELQE